MSRVKLPCIFLEKDEDAKVYRVLFMDPGPQFVTVQEFPYPEGHEKETKYRANRQACQLARDLKSATKMQVVGLRTN